MKKAFVVGRIIVQVVLVGQMGMFALAAPFFVPLFFSDLAQKRNVFPDEFAYACGSVGLGALYASIFVPVRILQAQPVARAVVVSGILAGFWATELVICNRLFPHDFNKGLWTLYLYGGPIVVGAWNLARIYRRPA